MTTAGVVIIMASSHAAATDAGMIPDVNTTRRHSAMSMAMAIWPAGDSEAISLATTLATIRGDGKLPSGHMDPMPFFRDCGSQGMPCLCRRAARRSTLTPAGTLTVVFSSGVVPAPTAAAKMAMARVRVGCRLVSTAPASALVSMNGGCFTGGGCALGSATGDRAAARLSVMPRATVRRTAFFRHCAMSLRSLSSLASLSASSSPEGAALSASSATGFRAAGFRGFRASPGIIHANCGASEPAAAFFFGFGGGAGAGTDGGGESARLTP